MRSFALHPARAWSTLVAFVCALAAATTVPLSAAAAGFPLCALRSPFNCSAVDASAWGDGSVYIEELDRGDFLKAFLAFGIPCIVCAVIGGLAFWHASFKVRLLPSVVAGWSALKDDVRLEKWLAWCSVLLLLVCALPSLFILLWGIFVYVRINHLLGFALFLVLMAVQLAAYAVAHFKVNGFRSDRLVGALLAIAILLMWTLELWTVYLREPYTYFNLSVVYVSFNFLPIVLLTYLVARSRTRPLQLYPLLDTDPVADYHTFLAETAAQQKRKATVQDSAPIAVDRTVLSVQVDQGKGAGSEEKKEQRIEVRPAAASGDHVVDVKPAESSSALAKAISSLATRSSWAQLACYFASLLVLLAYALSVHLIKNSGGFGNVVGWITSGTIICLDLCVWLCVYSGRISTPLEACIYQGACRIILVLFGDVYWFLGHSALYVVLGAFFGNAMVEHLLPKLNATQQKGRAIDDLLLRKPAGESESLQAMESINRHSESLGFVPRGRFAQTRFGVFLLRWLEFVAFGFLTLAFLVDLIVNSATSTVPLRLQRDHEQYLVGVLALFLVGVILSSKAILRMYYNRDWRIDTRLLLACGVQWVIATGCGVFLYALTKSIILICCFVYLPPIVYLAVFAGREWYGNDFQMWIDPPKPGETTQQQRKVRNRGRSQATSAAGASPVTPAPADSSNNVPITPSGIAPPSPAVADLEEQKSSGGAPANASAIPPSPNSPVSPIVGAPVAPAAVRMEVHEVRVNLGRWNSTWDKYRIALCAGASALLVLGMGTTIAAIDDPAWIGYTISACILILACTAIPIIEWFNSFDISRNMIVQLSISGVSFLAFILIFYLQGLDGASDNRSLALLLLLFVYPIVVVLVFAVLKWKDDKWVMGKFVQWALYVCCALLAAFFIAVAAVYDPWQIGVALLAGFIVILGGAFLVPVLSKRWPWLIKWAVIAGLCVLIAFAAGVGSQRHYGFVGFSLAWGILFACVAFSAWQSHANGSPTAVLSHMASPNLLPVFKYNTQPGVRNPMQSDDRRVYLAYGAMLLGMLWGVLAIFFVRATWIGLGVHAIALQLMVLYAAEAVSRPRILLARAVRYLVEGSPLYVDAVHRAKLAAFRSQLSSIKSTSLSPDQQLQPVSPTVSPEPSNVGAGEVDEEKQAPSAAAAGAQQDKPKQESKQNFLECTLSMAQEAARNAEPGELVLSESDLTLLGLNDPTGPRPSELDWILLYKVFAELRKATPLPSLLAFTDGAECKAAQVAWKGGFIPRRTAHDLLLKLDHTIALLHKNHLAYLTQVTMELILGAESIRSEHEQEILTMLRDTGHGGLTAEYLAKLGPHSDERAKLELALLEWKKQQEQIKLDRIRKRAEDEAARIRREEEDRERIRAEEQKIIRARQEQMRADEASAQRKQEELRAREAAELAQREEQRLRTEQAARLEQERVQREQADAARRKHEEEVAARLIAEKNEHALQELRAKQEAQRKADLARQEQERLQLAKLAEEQRIRDAALAAEKVLQQKVAAAVAKHVCTIKETGSVFVKQVWWKCLSCSSPNNEGVCATCKDVCHAGHKLQQQEASPFWCDCGKTGCEAATGVKPEDKGKPTLASIEAEFARTGVPWTDPEFSPTTASLLRDPAGSSHPDWKEIKWKRPEELLNMHAPVMYEGGADPLDINRDCWFLSAMSVMTQRQKDFGEIFISKEHSKAGVYSLNFYKNGERVNVLIDSLFPAAPHGRAGHAPAFGRSAKDNELWVMILEKAYAKLHRSYEAIEAGHVDQALVDLSGGIGSRIDMSKDPFKQQARNGQLFKQLLAYRAAGFLLGAGSPAGSDSEANASASGIVQGHAYAILDVQEVDSYQLLRLRNPWGRKEWTGDWSDKSPLWTRRMKAKLVWRDEDDGAFWMSMTDFAIHFDEIYVCRFFAAEDGWTSLPVIKGEWKDETAGGCTNFDSVKDNPQYLLTVTEPGTNILLNLSQSDMRGTSGKLKPIAIELYQNKGQRITRTRTGPLVCSNPDSYIFRREVSVEQELAPGAYTVLLSTFNQHEETKWTLSTFSTKPVKLELLPPAPAKARR